MEEKEKKKKFHPKGNSGESAILCGLAVLLSEESDDSSWHSRTEVLAEAQRYTTTPMQGGSTGIMAYYDGWTSHKVLVKHQLLEIDEASDPINPRCRLTRKGKRLAQKTKERESQRIDGGRTGPPNDDAISVATSVSEVEEQAVHERFIKRPRPPPAVQDLLASMVDRSKSRNTAPPSSSLNTKPTIQLTLVVADSTLCTALQDGGGVSCIVERWGDRPRGWHHLMWVVSPTDEISSATSSLEVAVNLIIERYTSDKLESMAAAQSFVPSSWISRKEAFDLGFRVIWIVEGSIPPESAAGNFLMFMQVRMGVDVVATNDIGDTRRVICQLTRLCHRSFGHLSYAEALGRLALEKVKRGGAVADGRRPVAIVPWDLMPSIFMQPRTDCTGADDLTPKEEVALCLWDVLGIDWGLALSLSVDFGSLRKVIAAGLNSNSPPPSSDISTDQWTRFCAAVKAAAS